jgi:hypothetical protein
MSNQIIFRPGGSNRVNSVRVLGFSPPIEPPPSGNWEPTTNRPGTGWTTWTDRSWSASDQLQIAGPSGDFSVPRTSDGWDEAFARAGALPEFISGVTGDPNGDGRILRQTYNGTPDGAEPKFLNNAIQSTQEIFMVFICRFGPDFLWPPSSGIKWLIFGDGVSGWLGTGRVAGVSGVYPTSDLTPTREAGQFTVDFNSGHATPTRLFHDPNFSLPRGQWTKIQMWCRRGGGGDVCKVWFDDVLRIDSDLVSFSYGPNLTSFNNLELCSTWGGGVGQAGYSGTDVEFDRVVVYRK